MRYKTHSALCMQISWLLTAAHTHCDRTKQGVQPGHAVFYTNFKKEMRFGPAAHRHAFIFPRWQELLFAGDKT